VPRQAAVPDSRRLKPLANLRRGEFSPECSHIGLLCNLERVVDLDAEVAHGALDLGMAKRLGFILRIS
jgi:hypothetical protein